MKKLILVLIFFAVSVSLAPAQNTVTTVTGTVTEVNHPTALLSAGDGTVYKMFLGPYWYWKNNGYNLLLEQAAVSGVIKDKNIYPYEITQNGNTIKLKDENGIALWGGKGKGKGRNCPYNNAGYKKNNSQNEWNGYGRGRGNNPNCPYNQNN
ncbi:MAG: hypothetical protein L0Y76_06520 [Ignavibacteria bacterium]|nr:hypothetical protein [Ignavibacteria bacterium]